jgi:hypothetical protein
MYRVRTQQAADWQSAAKELTEARHHLAENGGIMTPYERHAFNEEFTQRRNSYKPQIEAGAVAMLEASFSNFQAAQRGVDQSLAREIVRWDPTKLNAEIQLTNALVDQQFAQGVHVEDIAAKMGELLTEAKAAGPEGAHKLRAVCEVVKALPTRGRDPDERLKLNRVAGAAVQELSALRFTPELQAAHDKREEAAEGLKAAHAEADAANIAIDGRRAEPALAVNEIERNMLRLEIHRRTGEVTIHPDYQTALERRGADYVQGQRE